MLGKMRAAPALDFSERPPSKIIKDDSLSIYEVTLMKLKEGSRNELNSQPGIASNLASDGPCETVSPDCEPMTIDTDVSGSVPPDCSNSRIMESSNQQEKRTVSVQSLFSKYKRSHQAAVSKLDGTASIPVGASYHECMSRREPQVRGECSSSLAPFQVWNINGCSAKS